LNPFPARYAVMPKMNAAASHPEPFVIYIALHKKSSSNIAPQKLSKIPGDCLKDLSTVQA
jgi:hypothetical protein